MSGFAAIWQIAGRVTGSVLGSTYSQYRPSGANNPTGAGNLLRTIPCWITADPKGMATKPFAWDKPFGYSLHDPALTQVGDYLIGPLGTFFIASQDVPAPVQVVRCNHVLTFARPSGPAPGAGYYGGDVTASETPLMASWPASVLPGTKGEGGEAKLPGDVRLPWFKILLPSVGGVELLSADQALDEQATPLRYTLSSVSLTPLGWQMTAMLATP